MPMPRSGHTTAFRHVRQASAPIGFSNTYRVEREPEYVNPLSTLVIVKTPAVGSIFGGSGLDAIAE